MNVNAKIDWHAGMELTAQTFIELDKNLDRQQQITRRIVNGGDFGIIPAAPFHCQGGFVKKKDAEAAARKIELLLDEN